MAYRLSMLESTNAKGLINGDLTNGTITARLHRCGGTGCASWVKSVRSYRNRPTLVRGRCLSFFASTVCGPTVNVQSALMRLCRRDSHAVPEYPARYYAAVSECSAGLNLFDVELYMFVLDARLVQDTFTVGDFPLCRLLLSNDSNYPWFILVPRRADIVEVFELAEADQLQLWKETSTLSSLLSDAFKADKLNVAALGNVVSQLHMHVIVRYRSDAAWPAPVWGKHAAKPYTPEQITAVYQQLKDLLPDDFKFAQEPV